MPKYRKYRRVFHKRFKPVSKLAQVADIANRALKKATRVKNMVNVEYKRHDVQLTTTATSSTATINQLTNIAQGDSDLTRDGSDIVIKRIELKYFITQHATASITYVRVMLVQDTQTNEAIYAAADLLEDVTANDAIVSPLLWFKKRRFKVLYDRTHALSDVWKIITEMHTINLGLNMKVVYDASTPSIADVITNSLSFFTISTEATNTPSITFFSRVFFIDN